MKKVILMLLYVLSVYFINPLCLNAQNFSWAQSFNPGVNVNNPGIGVKCMIANDSNYSISVGVFRGTVDFDKSSNVFNVTSSGANSLFILKEDLSGNFIWVKVLNCTPIVKYFGFGGFVQFDLDEAENIYLTGSFTDSADFDPGPNFFYLGAPPPPQGGNYRNQYLLKLDKNGDFVWAKQLGNYFGGVDFRGMKIKNSRIYLAGVFSGSLDVAPDSSIVMMSSIGPIGAGIIESIDTSGSFIWAKQINNDAAIMGMDIDNFCNIHIIASFNDTVDFDPSSNIFNLISSKGGRAIAVVKYDSIGNLTWAKQIGMGLSGHDLANDISVDRWGNVFVTGCFGGTVDFDPGLGVYNLTSKASRNTFTLKLHSNGDFAWAQQPGGINVGLSEGRMIATDTFGNVYVVSSQYPTQKYDSSGNLLWKLTSSGFIALDKDNAIYISGVYSSLFNVDFDPGPGVYNMSSGGGTAGFILKLCQEPLVPFTLSADTVCTGDSLYLSIAPIAGATYYYWLRNDTLRAGSVSNNSPGLSGGGFYHAVAYGNDCPIASQKIFVQELPKKLPRISLSAPSPVPAGQTVTVSALILGYSGSYSIDWYSNNTYLATTQTNTYNLVKQPANELLHAWLHPVTKCYDSAISLPIWVTTTVTSATTVNANTTPSVYPNPFSQELTFSGLVSGDRIRVMDITGRVLYHEDAEQGTLKMDTQELAVGYYIIKLYSSDGHLKGNFPLVKQ